MEPIEITARKKEYKETSPKGKRRKKEEKRQGDSNACRSLEIYMNK